MPSKPENAEFDFVDLGSHFAIITRQAPAGWRSLYPVPTRQIAFDVVEMCQEAAKRGLSVVRAIDVRALMCGSLTDGVA